MFGTGFFIFDPGTEANRLETTSECVLNGSICIQMFEVDNLGKKKYIRQIQSFHRVIQEHLDKINNEKSKKNPNEKLLHYWEKEIENFKNEILKSEKRLDRG